MRKQMGGCVDTRMLIVEDVQAERRADADRLAAELRHEQAASQHGPARTGWMHRLAARLADATASRATKRRTTEGR